MTSAVIYTSDLRFSSSPTLHLSLPAGTREGGSNWFILHLHYKVTLSQRAGDSSLQVTTDRIGCAYIDLQRRNTGASATMTSVGLIDGTRTRVVHGSAGGWFRNYLAIAGVHGGQNRIDLIVAQPRNGLVQSATFFPDSYIERVKTGPTILRIGAAVTPSASTVGKIGTVNVRLLFTGARPGRVVVTVRTRGRPIRLLGPSRAKVRLRRDRPIRVRFRLRSLRPGTAAVDVLASSDTASTGVTVRVVVRRRR